jgi:hypothetical protein
VPVLGNGSLNDFQSARGVVYRDLDKRVGVQMVGQVWASPVKGEGLADDGLKHLFSCIVVFAVVFTCNIVLVMRDVVSLAIVYHCTLVVWQIVMILPAHYVHEFGGVLPSVAAEIHAVFLSNVVGFLAEYAECRVCLAARNGGGGLELPLGNVEVMSVRVHVQKQVWVRLGPDPP